MSDPTQIEHKRMGQGSVHTTTLGEGFVISRGNIFDCDALGMEMERRGTGEGSVGAYHDENEKMTAAKETKDDDGWRVFI